MGQSLSVGCCKSSFFYGDKVQPEQPLASGCCYVPLTPHPVTRQRFPWNPLLVLLNHWWVPQQATPPRNQLAMSDC